MVVNIARYLFDVGVEQHKLEGQLVRVTSIARTVADCVGFRNQPESERVGCRDGSPGVGVAKQASTR